MVNIRPATIADLHSITEIYNEAILNTAATFYYEPLSYESQATWFNWHGNKYPIIVAESNGAVVGWAALNKFSDRQGYDHTGEISFYVHHEWRGKGIGSDLLQMLTLESEEAGFHTIISRISDGNDVSIHLHEKLGYKLIGTMKEAGLKFDKWWDVHLLQIVFKPE